MLAERETQGRVSHGPFKITCRRRPTGGKSEPRKMPILWTNLGARRETTSILPVVHQAFTWKLRRKRPESPRRSEAFQAFKPAIGKTKLDNSDYAHRRAHPVHRLWSCLVSIDAERPVSNYLGIHCLGRRFRRHRPAVHRPLAEMVGRWVSNVGHGSLFLHIFLGRVFIANESVTT